MNLRLRQQASPRGHPAYYAPHAGVDPAARVQELGVGLFRVGPLPAEVENLLDIAIKRACRGAGIDKLEPGPKGAVISLRRNRFANSAGLVELIQRKAGTARLRPDHKIVYLRNWDDPKFRLAGAAKLVQAWAKPARAAPAEAAAPNTGVAKISAPITGVSNIRSFCYFTV